MAFINGIQVNLGGIEDNSLPKNLLGELNNNALAQEIVFPEPLYNSLFTDSPFGINWDTKRVVSYLGITEDVFGQDPDPQQPVENIIIYHIYIDTDAVQLIDAYRKDNLYRKMGSFADKVTDINIYYEDATKDDEFGSICFVRFNETLKKYFKSYKNAIDWLTKEIVDQSEADKKTDPELLSLDAERIKDAIAFELEYGSDGIEIFKKIALWLLHKLAEEIRGWKYTEKNWDFNKKDYDPLIGSNMMRGIVDGWNNFQKKAYAFFKKCYKVAEWSRANIPQTGELLANFIYSIVDFFTDILEGIDKFFQLLEEILEFVAIVNAFICGILNELMEAAAGVIDLLALLVSLTDKADRALMIEGLENMLDAYKHNPEKILDKLTETWNDLKARYGEDKSPYQKAYNAGEDFVDVVLFIDILVGVVKLFRNIPKLLKDMEKWILKKGKKFLKTPAKVITEEFAALSKKIAGSIKTKELLQNSNNLEELYKAAKEANKELEKITKRFATETNGEAGFRPKNVNDGLKDRARVLEKIEGENNGITSSVLDIAGSKVIYETVADLYKALKKFENDFEILRFKDRIQNPLPNGYRDILMNIKMKNGHIVEFRLHLKAMDEAAAIEHNSYKIIRSITAKAKMENRKLKLDEFKTIQELNNESQKIYENAWNKIISN